MRAPRRRFGAHMSVAGGVHRAFARAESVGCDAMQVFVKNANRWSAPPIPRDEAGRFRAERRRTGIGPVIAHASYLANLASPDAVLRRKSVAAVVDELERCERLGLEGLVLHPGSHVGSGEARGLRRVARSLDVVFRRTRGFGCLLLLETTAGQGSNLGRRFEHLARIRAEAREPERIGWCLDTCHVFAAGYDLRTGPAVRATLDELDAVCGLGALRAVHLNDSLRPFDSRRDRHAHVGEGAIGLRGFRAFLRDPRLREVPMILETPKGEDLREDARNLEVARALAAGKALPRRSPPRTDAWRRGTLRGTGRNGTLAGRRKRGHDGNRTMKPGGRA